ncbi:type II toxin-antitoxin system HicB family antitoxin [Haloplanus salinarum]|uniref:type II toxin-antitoxin system HicB family antitoxin n=1 Tax=Haloplanus salinarum TaxID=1912324 RepID=UPI003B43CB3F
MTTDSTITDDLPAGAVITLRREGERWVAKEEKTGVVSQGTRRQEALENLDEALQGYHGAGEPPSEDELRELGIDFEQNTSGALDDSATFD